MSNDTIPVTIHLMDVVGNYGGGSLCKKAVMGDKAITIEQAEDPSNGMSFNCRECYKKWRGEYPV